MSPLRLQLKCLSGLSSGLVSAHGRLATALAIA
jgi:hypothetical protein